MRKLQLTALLLCAAMALPTAGCGSKAKSKNSTPSRNIADGGDAPQAQPASNVYQNDANIGKNEIIVDIKQEAESNDTGFTLNRAIRVTPDADFGYNGNYIYLDVTIRNDTDATYDLSTLNNFYLIYSDGTEKYSDIQTELYANSRFNNFSMSPYTVPANGELSCIIGGFAVDSSLDQFTVGFFPTKENDRNKENVIKVEVKPDMLVDNPTDILK